MIGGMLSKAQVKVSHTFLMSEVRDIFSTHPPTDPLTLNPIYPKYEIDQNPVRSKKYKKD